MCCCFQQSKKKATNQRIKPRKLNVVLLQEREDKVPKGKKRAGLNMSGRIKKLEFKRCMTADEVKNTISNGFSNHDVQKIQFLCCGKDNTLLNYESQDLDGDGIIDLAGQGSLYILQVAICTYTHIYVLSSILNRCSYVHVATVYNYQSFACKNMIFLLKCIGKTLACY